MQAIFLSMLLLMGPQAAAAADPGEEGSPRRPPLDFRVFRDTETPVVGRWDLRIPKGPTRHLEITYLLPDNPNALVGVDRAANQEILRLDRKKKGIGYSGHLMKVLSACGLEQVPVTEFVPVGQAILLKFLAQPTPVACPAIDEGLIGHFVVVSRSGSPVHLKDLSDLSSPNVKNTYSIGGDRPTVDGALLIPVGSVAIEPGTKVKFLHRIKAPLDGSFWYEVEVPLEGHGDETPPRGYLRASSLQFVGALTLSRPE